MKIEIYETTLRDGVQGACIPFTDEDKIKVISALDASGISYIEIGDFTAGDITDSFLKKLSELKLENSKLAVLGAARRIGTMAEESLKYITIAKSPIPVVTVSGKAWNYQITKVLTASLEENLAMIYDTVAYFKAAGKQLIFDAEHFFDGYSDNPEYALAVLETAISAGCDTVVLCGSNGGMFPSIIAKTVASVKNRFRSVKVGIYCHNDIGLTVSDSVEAVFAGASHIQGALTGSGKQCENASLSTLIPLLQLKTDFSLISPERLTELTKTARILQRLQT